MPSKVLFMLAMVIPALLSLKLETEESVTNYNPQRVMRHFHLDQGSIIIYGLTSFLSIHDSRFFVDTE